jgi:uncharacterized protein YdaU (DUF1376 family)
MEFRVHTFFGSTMEMTGPEMALYLLTLNYAWMNEARLPTDEERLRRTLRYDKDEWAKAWPVVSKKWAKDGAWLKNNKLSLIYAEAWERIRSAITDGKRGGLAKAANANRDRGSATDPTTPPTTPPSSTPLPLTLTPTLRENSSLTPNSLSISGENPPRKKRGGTFRPPSVEEIQNYADEKGWPKSEFNADYFFESYGAKGWMIGKSPMKDWRLAAQKAHREGWTVLKTERGAPPSGQPKRKIQSLAEVNDGSRR